MIDVQLTAIRLAARDIHLFELSPAGDTTLPPYAPGAHVDLHLPNAMVRQYSLATPFRDGRPYVLGVKLDPDSRGGSRFMHEQLRVGTRLRIAPPRNLFPLADDDAPSVFVAGGIGITPIHCMVRALSALGRRWHLHYAVRDRAHAAFVDELGEHATHLSLHVDAEHSGRPMDIEAIVAASPAGAHFYCCGPTPMLEAYQRATRGLPPHTVHLEHFGSTVAATAGQPFDVVLARTRRRLRVPAGQSITQAMREQGIDPLVSCEQGICGACETPVLAGVPDHRDLILTAEEKAANRSMMICCSRSLTPVLELDL